MPYKLLLLLIYCSIVHGSPLRLVMDEDLNKTIGSLDFLLHVAWNITSRDSTCYFVDTDEYTENRAIERFLENTDYPYILCKTGDELTTLQEFPPFPNCIFFFCKNILEAEKKLKYFLNSYYTKAGCATSIILFEGDTEQIEPFVRRVWKMKLTKFVVSFLGDMNKLFTYDGLKDRVINITEINFIKQNLGSNKLMNLHRQEIRIAVFSYPPKTYKYSNQSWHIEDEEFWQTILKDSNASYQFIETEPYSMQNAIHIVSEGKADCCVKLTFMTDLLKNLLMIAPYAIENLVVLVPKSPRIPQYLYIFMSLRSVVWTCIIISLISIRIMIFFMNHLPYFDRKRHTTSECLDLLGILVSKPLKNYEKYRKLQKFLLLIWQVMGFILCGAFQCALLSSLLVAKYENQIDTLEELRQSNLSIYVSDEFNTFVENHVPQLKDQYLQYSPRDINYLLNHRFHNQTIVMPDYDANYILHYLNKRNRDNEYRVMKEPLLPGFSTYFFTRGSPLVPLFNEILLRRYQYGLYRGRQNIAFKPLIWSRTQENCTPLTLKHLQGSFYVLATGLGLSLAVFCLEISTKSLI
ncbi:hypothetical protein WA026_013613 [Henosepilachna vigintioctopunctata]|uniref:Ionotropic glutamate receptor C-terminal domain-containing protein n=1 Tax=Henosepilachna vigintioctopunctata TaxID=420089 RepID=A0AAW1VDU3_9CUCU